MRLLTTVTGSPSHARAVLPFARAVGAAGHEVMVACPPQLASVFDGAPVRVAPVFPEMADAAARFVPRIRALGPRADPAEVIAQVFGGEHVTDEVRGLRELCAGSPPDLVLRDGGETAGLLYAEELGVRHVPAPSGAAHVLDPARLGPLLAQRRIDLGMPAPDDPAALAPWGRLDCLPAAYSFAPAWLPPAQAFRQDDEVVRGERLPDWIAALPAGRPLVLGSLGTALPMIANRSGTQAPGAPPVDPAAGLRALIAAAGSIDDAEIVIATGGLEPGVEPAPHVHLERWVPQPLLLQVADALVTHGGYNTVREAVRHGVPMVAFPQFGDQFAGAERIASLGLGRRADAASLAATIRGVLDDAAIHGRARAAQRAMLALPPIDARWPARFDERWSR